MSNGVKIGILIVVAGALGFVAWRQLQASDKNEISSRPAVPGQLAASASPEAQSSNSSASNAVTQPEANSPGQASQTRAKTTWKFDKDTHDFGKIKQGDDVEYNFKFTNTGKEPLIIENAQGSCGCTVPSYPKEPVPPGGTGEIHVKFNSAGKSGAQQKTVTLTANTDPSVTTLLTIKADVEVPAGSGN